MMMTKSDMAQYADRYPLVPVWRTLPTAMTSPVDILRRLDRPEKPDRRFFVLESSDNNEDGEAVLDRYAYVAFEPRLTIAGLDDKLTLTVGGRSMTTVCRDPIGALRNVLSENRAPRLEGLPPFFGGFAGYFSYEYIHLSEPTCRFSAENRDKTKDFELMLFDRLYVLDRQEKTVMLICQAPTVDPDRSLREAEACLDAMERELADEALPGEPLHLLGDFEEIYTKAFYTGMIEKAKAAIRAGDVAQIVLTNGRRVKAEGHLTGTFEALRQNDLTRYMCYFRTEDVEAAMASPEPILKLRDGTVMTERLAGSYPRGKTPEEDRAFAEALRRDAKAVDEHNMLVDDSRNEFGYVSRIGTVRVENYLNVVRCARVMHLGSTIKGDLKPEMGALDVINAIMPSGAVSGAPKIRACEVINEIEQERRGIYGSAVGYIGFDGDADFFVFIHSAFLKDGILTVRAGGGIVIDSDADEEYREAMVKTEAMLNTVCQAAKEA